MFRDDRWEKVKAVIIRHRFTIRDVGAIAAIVVVAAAFALQLDVFPNQSDDARKAALEFDELFGVLALAFGLFSWSRLLAQRREMRRRVTAEQEARSLSLEDPLTGLPNRRQFDQALRAAMSALPGADAAHAVLMIDLNGFKRINDAYGHAAGDEVLIQVANRLRRAIRQGDLLARLGGDEFSVLAPHVNGPEAATGLALRLIEALAPEIAGGGLSHRLGAGIGIALGPQDGIDPATLLRKADVALYRAKAEGVSALRFFEPDMDERIRERDRLERDLRQAIGTPALRVLFQPLVDLKSGAITGFEALARWQHPEFGELEPARFIPVAEDSGLIGDLTDFLLRQAARDAATWPSHTTLSFNISPVQLKDRGLGPRLLRLLAEEKLSPMRLELEITESALVRDMDDAQLTLGTLREAGVRIALDDFGTGYSSLYHLRNFKLDKIKIDRSFVAAMAHDRESAAIVRALVGLGAGLGLTVTAEGVEDAEQYAMLEQQGCQEGQGFLFSRPVPSGEAMRLARGDAHVNAAGALATDEV